MGAKDDFTNLSVPSLSVQIPPLMTRDLFATLIGLELGVLVSQCEKGYWPEVRIGKRTFINVELVRKQCLDREFSL